MLGQVRRLDADLGQDLADRVLTLGTQYHVIRLLKSTTNSHGLFLYLVLDRAKANLALARHSLKRIESEISL